MSAFRMSALCMIKQAVERSHRRYAAWPWAALSICLLSAPSTAEQKHQTSPGVAQPRSAPAGTGTKRVFSRESPLFRRFIPAPTPGANGRVRVVPTGKREPVSTVSTVSTIEPKAATPSGADQAAIRTAGPKREPPNGTAVFRRIPSTGQPRERAEVQGAKPAVSEVSKPVILNRGQSGGTISEPKIRHPVPAPRKRLGTASPATAAPGAGKTIVKTVPRRLVVLPRRNPLARSSASTAPRGISPARQPEPQRTVRAQRNHQSGGAARRAPPGTVRSHVGCRPGQRCARRSQARRPRTYEEWRYRARAARYRAWLRRQRAIRRYRYAN